MIKRLTQMVNFIHEYRDLANLLDRGVKRAFYFYEMSNALRAAEEALVSAMKERWLGVCGKARLAAPKVNQEYNLPAEITQLASAVRLLYYDCKGFSLKIHFEEDPEEDFMWFNKDDMVIEALCALWNWTGI